MSYFVKSFEHAKDNLIKIENPDEVDVREAQGKGKEKDLDLNESGESGSSVGGQNEAMIRENADKGHASIEIEEWKSYVNILNESEASDDDVDNDSMDEVKGFLGNEYYKKTKMMML